MLKLHTIRTQGVRIRIFVTATNTDIGKTHTILLLMEEAARCGLRPAAFKPIETGVTPKGPADGLKLLHAMRRLNPDTERLAVGDIVPYRFELPAAPFVAKGETKIRYDYLEEKMKEVERLCDILFIEGAGGLMVPIDGERFMIDLPRLFDAHTLLVAPGRLGSINDTLLSIEALRNRGIGFDLAVNLQEEREDFEKVTRPYYRAARIDHCLLPEESGRCLDRLMRSGG